jgi:outer membrane protein assembly factor BamB
VKQLVLTLIILGLLFLIPFGLWQDVRLFALNAASGRVVWSRSLPNDKAWTSYPQIAKAGERDIVLVWAGEDKRETLFAFDAVNGKRLWTHSSGGWLYEAQVHPLSLAGTIGVYSHKGKEELVALDLATGQEKWRVSSNLDESYVGESNYVLSNQSLNKVIAVLLDESKQVIRSYDTEGILLSEAKTTAYDPDYFSFIAGDDKEIYIAPGYIYKLNSETGEVMFTAEVDARGGFTFAEQTLYAAWVQDLSALDASSGKTVWNYNEAEMRGLFQSPVISEHIYVTYSVMSKQDKTTGAYYPDSWLFALDKNGQELWRKVVSSESSDNLVAFAQTPTLIPGGVVVIGETALLAFNGDGTERWRFPLEAQCKSAGSTDELVYVTAGARRYQHWLAYLNPLWH